VVVCSGGIRAASMVSGLRLSLHHGGEATYLDAKRWMLVERHHEGVLPPIEIFNESRSNPKGPGTTVASTPLCMEVVSILLIK
jgi:hypothetical protein